MEKHWASVVNKSVCDYFFEEQAKAPTPADVPPVIPTPHYYLISIFRNNLYFVAVLQNEGLFLRALATDNIVLGISISSKKSFMYACGMVGRL